MCSHLGEEYINLYNEYNNYLSLDREEVLKEIELLLSQIKIAEKKILTLYNQENIKVTQILPEILPNRLVGKNYAVKQTSIKIVDNVWQEFQQFIKNNKDYSGIEYLSLAILEFLEKYNKKTNH